MFSRDVSDLCADQTHRSEVTKIVYHMAQVFRLLPSSYHSGFIETITPLSRYVNIKVILFFVD